MIEFRGEYSKACKEFVRRAMSKNNKWANVLLSLFVFGGMAVVSAVCFISIGAPWMIVFSALILIIGVIVLRFVPTKVDGILPEKIVFQDKNFYYETERGEGELCSYEDVETVNDWGEWYTFTFCPPQTENISFICQKDLIVQGTIEEFETLFQGKIVRKVSE